MTDWTVVPRSGLPYCCNRRGCGAAATVEARHSRMAFWMPLCEAHRPDRERPADELTAAVRDRGRALHDLAEEKRKTAALSRQLRAAHEANRVLHADVAELVAAGGELARGRRGWVVDGHPVGDLARWDRAVTAYHGRLGGGG